MFGWLRVGLRAIRCGDSFGCLFGRPCVCRSGRVSVNRAINRPPVRRSSSRSHGLPNIFFNMQNRGWEGWKRCGAYTRIAPHPTIFLEFRVWVRSPIILIIYVFFRYTAIFFLTLLNAVGIIIISAVIFKSFGG